LIGALSTPAATTSLACSAESYATADIRRSVIEENHQIGLSLIGAESIVEDTVVHGTRPEVRGLTSGNGISLLFPGETGSRPHT
jgi:hypothetical protein